MFVSCVVGLLNNMAEDSKHNVVQDMRLLSHESRLEALESTTDELIRSTTALTVSVEQTNRLLTEGFNLMKKLAVAIIGIIGSVVGVTSI